MDKSINKPLPEMIEEIIERGYTEQKIADKTGLGQNTINRVKTGKIKNPGWTVGLKIYDGFLNLK